MNLYLCWLMGHDWRDPWSWWPAFPNNDYVGDLRCSRCEAYSPDWRGWV